MAYLFLILGALLILVFIRPALKLLGPGMGTPPAGSMPAAILTTTGGTPVTGVSPGSEATSPEPESGGPWPEAAARKMVARLEKVSSLDRGNAGQGAIPAVDPDGERVRNLEERLAGLQETVAALTARLAGTAGAGSGAIDEGPARFPATPKSASRNEPGLDAGSAPGGANDLPHGEGVPPALSGAAPGAGPVSVLAGKAFRVYLEAALAGGPERGAPAVVPAATSDGRQPAVTVTVTPGAAPGPGNRRETGLTWPPVLPAAGEAKAAALAAKPAGAGGDAAPDGQAQPSAASGAGGFQDPLEQVERGEEAEPGAAKKLPGIMAAIRQGHARGESIESLARRFGRGKGEIALILNLHR